MHQARVSDPGLLSSIRDPGNSESANATKGDCALLANYEALKLSALLVNRTHERNMFIFICANKTLLALKSSVDHIVVQPKIILFYF